MRIARGCVKANGERLEAKVAAWKRKGERRKVRGESGGVERGGEDTLKAPHVIRHGGLKSGGRAELPTR